MEIKRPIYLQKLVSRKHNGMIKIVTGLRRSGKSYLLFKLFYEHLLAEGVSDEYIICSRIRKSTCMLPAATPGFCPKM